MTLAAGLATRLEKSALDNGFDRELPRVCEWLAFGSTHAPLDVWLRAMGPGHLLVAMSRRDVAAELDDVGNPVSADLPPGATGCLDVGTVPELNRLLRRAYQLARTLPHQLLRDFEQKTAAMPKATEAERLVVQRVGQEVFRYGLLEYWEGKCAITGLAVPELLRASHIKPWAACETDAERLDVFNGFLLAPNLDAAFDKGFITVSNDGDVVVSDALSPADRKLLGVRQPLRVERIQDGHRRYLTVHRETVYRSSR
jgi:hypothetical protein